MAVEVAPVQRSAPLSTAPKIPLWGWAAIVGGGIGLLFFITKGSNQNPQAAQVSTSAALGDIQGQLLNLRGDMATNFGNVLSSLSNISGQLNANSVKLDQMSQENAQHTMDILTYVNMYGEQAQGYYSALITQINQYGLTNDQQYQNLLYWIQQRAQNGDAQYQALLYWIRHTGSPSNQAANTTNNTGV